MHNECTQLLAMLEHSCLEGMPLDLDLHCKGVSVVCSASDNRVAVTLVQRAAGGSQCKTWAVQQALCDNSCT